MSSVDGPITVVSGKHRRITFIECPTDLNSMIDVAKVADLVLLMIDASYGFEMEIFEFLHIAQVHGLPRVMGVVTHLDCLPRKYLFFSLQFCHIFSIYNIVQLVTRQIK